jgi:outer membrane protein TolC
VPRLTHTSFLLLLALAFRANAQPPTIDLQDALARARKYGTQIQSANIAALLAREDSVQARAAALPSVNAFNQFIYTEGNGTPSGVFVANDGVHVYNEQAVVHQELLSIVRRGEIRRATAAEATAKARTDVAVRGLVATVVQDYYAIVSAGRRAVNAQTSLAEAGRFADITQKQEKGGEAAHSDVIKAQIQTQQRQRDVQDAQLAIEKAKIALAVLIFPTLQTEFTIVDDAQTAAILPPLPEAAAQAQASSPDLRVAQSSVVEAGLGIGIARYAYLPSFSFDFFYGINANQLAIDSPERHNLGYAAQVTLNVPVWNWGATRSKVKQAVLKERQAELDLTLAQRQLQAAIATAHKEAEAALAQVQSLRLSSDLAAESLRLTILRYQAGEATALEVVDAQTTAALARGAYDDGQVRYRVALAAIQTMTGNL